MEITAQKLKKKSNTNIAKDILYTFKITLIWTLLVYRNNWEAQLVQMEFILDTVNLLNN